MSTRSNSKSLPDSINSELASIRSMVQTAERQGNENKEAIRSLSERQEQLETKVDAGFNELKLILQSILPVVNNKSEPAEIKGGNSSSEASASSVDHNSRPPRPTQPSDLVSTPIKSRINGTPNSTKLNSNLSSGTRKSSNQRFNDSNSGADQSNLSQTISLDPLIFGTQNSIHPRSILDEKYKLPESTANFKLNGNKTITADQYADWRLPVMNVIEAMSRYRIIIALEPQVSWIEFCKLIPNAPLMYSESRYIDCIHQLWAFITNCLSPGVRVRLPTK